MKNPYDQHQSKHHHSHQSNQNEEEHVHGSQEPPCNFYLHLLDGKYQEAKTEDPDMKFDVLPQPFRLINKIIHGLLIPNINTEIDHLEKYKEDPNYEGFLKENQCSGSFHLRGITVASSCGKNKIIAGDDMGCLHILDVSKRVILGKRIAFKDRRIISIHCANLE